MPAQKLKLYSTKTVERDGWLIHASTNATTGTHFLKMYHKKDHEFFGWFVKTPEEIADTVNYIIGLKLKKLEAK